MKATGAGPLSPVVIVSLPVRGLYHMQYKFSAGAADAGLGLQLNIISPAGNLDSQWVSNATTDGGGPSYMAAGDVSIGVTRHSGTTNSPDWELEVSVALIGYTELTEPEL